MGLKYTGNYNLKKPEGTDVVNIEDLNDNADIIDQKLKEHEDAIAKKETPQGAQEKADKAEQNAKDYADSLASKKIDKTAISDSVTSTSSSTVASSKAVKTAYDKGNSAYSKATTNANNISNLEGELDDHKENNVKHLNYATASGTNSYTVSIPGISSLVEGMSFKIKFTNGNTFPKCTLNVNGLGAKSIKKSNGNDLSIGYIKAGQICHLVYNGSFFQLLGEGGEYGTAQPNHVLEGYTIGTEDGVVEGTMPNRGNVSKTLTTQGSSYTIPSGYHAGGGKVTANITNLSAGNIKKGVTVGGVAGTFTADATASASHILSGKTAYVNGSKITGTMPNKGAINETITTQGGQIIIPAGYHDGSGIVKAQFDNLVPENIKSGVNIGGVVGTYRVNVKPGKIEQYHSEDEGSATVYVNGTIRIKAELSANSGYEVRERVRIYYKRNGITVYTKTYNNGDIIDGFETTSYDMDVSYGNTVSVSCSISSWEWTVEFEGFSIEYYFEPDNHIKPSEN